MHITVLQILNHDLCLRFENTFYFFYRTEKELAGMDDAHEGTIWDMSWHPLGHMLVSGSNDHTTFVFIYISSINIRVVLYSGDFGHVIDLVILYLNEVKMEY